MTPLRKTILRRSVAEQQLIGISERLHPVIRRVLAARQVHSEAELDYTLPKLLRPEQLKGMEQAVDLLRQTLEQNRRILVVADFDADGATSCALAVRALTLMGAADVRYIVPDRFLHGYGLTPTIADLAAEHQPDLLITVDNGISSLAGVAAAKKHGMKVLITDHHLPGEQLPAADAIVNPSQPGDDFGSKSLAGVGVIFYVMLALRTHLREQGWFAARGWEAPNLGQLLDLVALGTVADVVPLDYNNRILVEQGLRRIRRGECCPGIRALAEIAGRDRQRLVASDLGFYLGPRLNAAGRMENMSHGIECLLNDDPAGARKQAEYLDMFNQERKVVEADMQLEALDILETMRLDEDGELPFGLCLFDPAWHEGVIGLLASRVKERVNRPVIVFTSARQQPQAIKGSARSIPELHIRDVLDSIATRHPGLITKFGGHAMAAGLTLARDHLETFRSAFDREVRRHLNAEVLRGVVHTDGDLAPEDFNLEFAETLRSLTPWGQGFPEPLFDGHFRLLNRKILKDRHLKMELEPEGGGHPLDAIAFNTQDHDWPETTSRVRLVYRLEVNIFRNLKSVQLLTEYVEPLPR